MIPVLLLNSGVCLINQVPELEVRNAVRIAHLFDGHVEPSVAIFELEYPLFRNEDSY